MAETLKSIVVKLDMSQVQAAIREALPSAETLARELHDVVFAFGQPIPIYDKLPPETRAWFVARAERMLAVLSGEEY